MVTPDHTAAIDVAAILLLAIHGRTILVMVGSLPVNRAINS